MAPGRRLAFFLSFGIFIAFRQIHLSHTYSRQTLILLGADDMEELVLKALIGVAGNFTEEEAIDADHLELVNTTNGQFESFAFVQEESLTTGGYDVKPLLQLSLDFQHPPSDIKAGICLKTLHGTGKKNLMNFVLTWVAYNRLMGFDEILVWYAKDFRPPGFELLESLPYVRLIENTRNPQIKPGEYEIRRDVGNGGQEGDIEECRNLTYKSFDWVFIADWDEYLWFKEKIRLKDFLKRHVNDSYISFGKWTYSYKDTVVANENLFGFEGRPFTLKVYCDRMNGKKYCPDSRGRSKVMHRPGFRYRNIMIHGNYEIDPRIGRIHMDPDIAHLKEWRSAFVPGNDTLHEKRSFKVPAFNPEFNEYKLNKDNKTYTMHYDEDLQDWFDFVAGKQERIAIVDSQ